MYICISHAYFSNERTIFFFTVYIVSLIYNFHLVKKFQIALFVLISQLSYKLLNK